MTLELWLVPLLLLILLARPLLTLTAGLRRIRPGTGHGSAHLASGREIRDLRPHSKQAVLRLGLAAAQPVALPEKEVYEHVLVCGPPGSGKSSGLIIPNILAERGARSLVIVDPKSELLDLTRAAVARHSEVWVVNFLDPRAAWATTRWLPGHRRPLRRGLRRVLDHQHGAQYQGTLLGATR